MIIKKSVVAAVVDDVLVVVDVANAVVAVAVAAVVASVAFAVVVAVVAVVVAVIVAIVAAAVVVTVAAVVAVVVVAIVVAVVRYNSIPPNAFYIPYPTEQYLYVFKKCKLSSVKLQCPRYQRLPQYRKGHQYHSIKG